MLNTYKPIILFLLVFIIISFSALAQRFQLTKEYDGSGIVLPKGIRYDQLFREGEIVVNVKGVKTISKGEHDYSCFIPKGKNGIDGFLFVSHESNDTSITLGDGGGATVFEVNKIDGRWINKGAFNAVDFSKVGGTFKNCSGALTPWGTILSAEEFPPASNEELFMEGRGSRDTSDFNGMKRYQNMGWVVEIDPVSKIALRKLYAMGRCSHEGILLMPDSVTVYLTDDFVPSVFYKFIAEKAGDLSKGKLFAYQQNANGNGGTWIHLPSDMKSLIESRNVALQRGATSFVRMEWLTLVDGKIYISETGQDEINLDKSVMLNSTWANHIQATKNEKGAYDYPYGAVLEFNPSSNSFKPLIAGGSGLKNVDKHFSNPDGITYAKLKGKTYLVINEDIIKNTRGRVPEEFLKKDKIVNEIWWLDLSLKNPGVDDLKRFLIAPVGAETTGGYFTADYSTYFLNIQHPDTDNPEPFNRSVTIAVGPILKKKGKNKR